MLSPDDITARDFGREVHGYEVNAVRSYLAEIAAAHAALQAELEVARRAPAPGGDPFADMGASVAAVLRAAKESADQVLSAATGEAATVRADADRYSDGLRQEADELRVAAQQAHDLARAQSDRMMLEARERAEQVDAQTAERVARVRVSLMEANEEMQLAVLALSEVSAMEPAAETPSEPSWG